ncbi:alpha/beta fold hydrolase [Sphingomonas sp. HF-S4]|uniref:Alpha/beta fold hydrolase n=1 Tax=Sphingomonas agrestis TaxID=3080540 RepID=A0ABU3YB58_9SPHN|nr:alpha/beta fold hydrolase [Sphingomonas sp. HF-S4]MDV3458635.1 alpha/beta fold hydrolase [Sphingomonas sp. HF-S4]
MQSIGLALFVAIALVPVARAQAPRETIRLEPGSVAASDGSIVRYEVGTLRVPENRANAASRTIGVGVIRIAAQKPSGAPPVFLLVGGPGITMIETLDDPSPAAKRRLRMWLDYAAANDLVIVEQRGYSLRGDMLELANPAMPLDKPFTVETDLAITLAQAKAVAGEHPGKDLSGYTIAECADDVDSVRRLLGYPKLILFGASFGSQWSFAVMQRHPETVARALLASVEPLDNGYDMPSHVFAAMQRIAYEAECDTELKPHIPQGGLIAAIRTIHDRLAAAPVVVDTPGGRITLGVGDFELALRARSTDAATWPAFVIDLYNGRYHAWAEGVAEQRKAASIPLISPLIDTATGVTSARKHQLFTDPATALLGTWNFAGYIGSTGAWPTLDMGDVLRLPVPNPVPVLFVQGDWDTNTPMENLTGILPWFPNAHALLIHRGQHTGPLPLLRDRPDLAAKVLRFLVDGSLEELPVEAELATIRFALPK